MGAYIAKMLPPTVSSLVFLTAASVATKRGFHIEDMVYFFTVGILMSQSSTLTMFGVLTCALRIYQDRWGYGIYSGPIGSAVFIITVKWLQKMRKEHIHPTGGTWMLLRCPGSDAPLLLSVSTTCLWLCPSCCCYPRRTAMQGQTATLTSSAATPSSAVRPFLLLRRRRRTRRRPRLRQFGPFPLNGLGHWPAAHRLFLCTTHQVHLLRKHWTSTLHLLRKDWTTAQRLLRGHWISAALNLFTKDWTSASSKNRMAGSGPTRQINFYKSIGLGDVQRERANREICHTIKGYRDTDIIRKGQALCCALKDLKSMAVSSAFTENRRSALYFKTRGD